MPALTLPVVARLVVLAAGTLAGSGMLALASGLAAATSLVLLEKTRVHAFVKRIDDESLRASARFAAMACIVLPLLPPALAHESRSHPANRVLGAAAVAACTVMLLRVTLACAVLNPALALQLPRFVWPSSSG